MSLKVIIVMPDESRWEVDARLVAENRADYYAEKEGWERKGEDWLSEVKYVLRDRVALKDWLMGNMEWGELDAKIVQPSKDVDYSKELYKASINVLEFP